MSEREWELTGWISNSKTGKSLVISDDKGKMIGMAALSTLHKMLKGEIKSCPIKLPIETEHEKVERLKKAYME